MPPKTPKPSKPLKRPVKMWAAFDLMPNTLDCYRTKGDAASAMRHTGGKPQRVLITPTP